MCLVARRGQPHSDSLALLILINMVGKVFHDMLDGRAYFRLSICVEHSARDVRLSQSEGGESYLLVVIKKRHVLQQSFSLIRYLVRVRSQGSLVKAFSLAKGPADHPATIR